MAAQVGRRLTKVGLLVCLLISASWGPVWSQDAVSFLANQIVVSADGRTIRASGDVEVAYQGNQILTEIVVYDRSSGTITFPKSFVFKSSDGSQTTATTGSVQDDLIAGVFEDVELQLTGQFKILASILEKIDENKSVLSQGIATSCRICEDGSEPIWQIRARSVEHLVDEQRLYFTDAVFEFLGIPVFYAPRVTTPDPSVDRASGFLIPSFKTSDTLGFGVEIPYYIVTGDFSDFTLRPFAATAGAFLVAAEYRQLFKNGALIATGAMALADPLSDLEFRSFATIKGSFELQNDFQLNFQANATSDRTFRSEYGFGDEDRLENFVSVSKTTEQSFFDISASTTQTLREGEDASQIPLVLPEIYFTRIDALGYGWSMKNELQSVVLFRENQQRTTRLGFRSTTQKDIITNAGLAVGISARAEGSFYTVENNPDFDDGKYDYLVPSLAATIRYPLAKSHKNNARSLIEPIVQVILAPDDIVNVPNEDSVQLEFEESNLFFLNRFPGFDAIEVGSRANLGVRYLYQAQDDWRLGVSLGQVFRLDDLNQFSSTTATGLDAQYSDTVLALTFEYSDRLSITNRTLIGRDFNVSKYESQLYYNADNWSVNLDYIYIEENVIAGGLERQDQIDLSLSYRANQFWTLRTDLRQDFVENDPIEQFFGAEFKNECILLDFGFTLDYATEGSNEAEQEFGITIELLGFGSDTGTQGRGAGCQKS